MHELRLGIDVACRESHRAALTDETGKIIWANRRFLTTSADLEALWAAVRCATSAATASPWPLGCWSSPQ